MSDLTVILIFGGALALLLLVLLLRRGPAPAAEEVPDGAILIDGSNVMHWGGEPDARALLRVIASVEEEGRVPFVCFDANVGYKLFGRFMGSRDMGRAIGVPEARVFVVDKGVVADGVLLDLAAEHGLEVVTNDRFRDWAGQHPWVKDHRRFRRGRWQDGSVIWGDARGKGRRR